MLSCKKIISFIAAAIALAGCMEQRIIFDFNHNVNRNFFKEIPGIGDALFIKYPVTKKATTAEIYVSSFREKYIENDNLLEFTELNDSSKIDTVAYWGKQGYAQDLYLLRYEFTYSAKTKKGKLIDVPVEAAVFFSIKYNSRGTIGVMPCYFGIVNDEDNLIAFDTELTLKKDNGNFYLKLHPKKKNEYGLLFMPAVFPTHPKTAEDIFAIEKIVELDPNKVGGYKPLVFNINKIFHDPNALKFHYVDTLHLNP
ncbi:MAG: hypothetical protein ABI472_07035 [Ginsengibacter sp.]